MNGNLKLLILSMAILAANGGLAADGPPPWAYPMNPPGFKPLADDGIPRQVAGSSASYTLTQTRDRFLAPDWHPEDRPAMPTVVASGRKPDVYACGYCHRATGGGGPENANISALPVEYIVQQMADFKSGTRRSSVSQRMPVILKNALARAVTDEEVAAAAAYFASLPPVRNIRVVETDRAPTTRVAGWVLVDTKTDQDEPIGSRIIETPDDPEHFELRDPRATFTAYVPRGSLARGAAIVAGAVADKGEACATCHGPALLGAGLVPPIVGRSPSYVVRQLYDFKHGARAGKGSADMRQVAAKLEQDDMVAIAAYLASRDQVPRHP